MESVYEKAYHYCGGAVQTWSQNKVIIGHDADHREEYDYWETPVTWRHDRFAHMLIVGQTGSGKTNALKALLCQMAWTIYPTPTLWLCDFKQDDFRFAKDHPHYYGYTDVTKGLDEFYQHFKKRQSGSDQLYSFHVLVFDEWSAYLASLDKAAAEAAKKKLSELLMLGRSFNIHVIICQQTAHTDAFGKSRDNFGAVLAMGELSKEGKEMLFSDLKDEMYSVDEIGTGYFRQGSRMRRVWIPEMAESTARFEILELLR